MVSVGTGKKKKMGKGAKTKGKIERKRKNPQGRHRTSRVVPQYEAKTQDPRRKVPYRVVNFS